MEKTMYCPMCKNQSNFASTESPTGYFVCGKCNYRTSAKKTKMIEDAYGYHFEVDKTQ